MATSNYNKEHLKNENLNLRKCLLWSKVFKYVVLVIYVNNLYLQIIL
jgi:hypothetical protein